MSSSAQGVEGCCHAHTAVSLPEGVEARTLSFVCLTPSLVTHASSRARSWLGFSPDGKLLAAASPAGVLCWDAVLLLELRTVMGGHDREGRLWCRLQADGHVDKDMCAGSCGASWLGDQG